MMNKGMLSRVFAALTVLLALGPAGWADTQVSEKIQMAQGDYEAHKQMLLAQQLADEGKLEEALNVLDGAKQQVRMSKRYFEADRLASDYHQRLVGKETKEGNLLREAEKRQRLFEVETYWLPPRPYDKEILEESPQSREKLPIEVRARKRIPLIDFKDASIKEVVEFFAKAADVNIVIDDESVTDEDRVTLYLKDIPMIEALNFVLKTKKLGARIEENIILVTNPDNLGVDLEVRVYDVQDLVGKLHDFPSTPFDFEKVAENSNSGGGGDEGEGGSDEG